EAIAVDLPGDDARARLSVYPDRADCRSEGLLRSRERTRFRVAGVYRRLRLDQQKRSSLTASWAVLDATRNDIQIAGPELDVAAAKLYRQPSVEDEKEVVGVRMGMPDELTPDLHEHHLVVIQGRDRARTKHFVEPVQRRSEVHRVVHAVLIF